MTSPAEEGPEDAPILLLGEAPSHDELRKQRPFVGPAGQLLDTCLHTAGIVRAQCRIVNVFPDMVKKPRDGEGKIFTRDGSTLLWTSSKGFTEAGRDAAAPALAHIRASSANVIVPLGGVALHLAVDVRSISRWRGSLLAGLDHRKTLPTFHPSYCLQGAFEARHVVISDLTRAKRESTFPELRLPQRRIQIDPSFAECIAFLKRALDAPYVDTDIELLGGQVDCFSLALSPSEVISIPIVDAGFVPRWSVEEEFQIWRLYAQILQAPRIAKVNQNIGFDLAALLQLNHIVPCGPLHDPMIAHSIMLPFIPKDLAMLCSLYTDEPYYKDQGDLRSAQTVDDFARRWRYNALDAAVALECWGKLITTVDEEGYRPLYDDTIAMLPSLIYPTVRGMKVNRAALEVARVKANEEIAALTVKLAEAFARPVITTAPKNVAQKRAAAGAININSPAQLMVYFYGEKKLKPYLNPTGKPTIDDKALARIMRRDGLPEASLLQQYRKIDKLSSTYLEVEYDEADERVHCSWNPRGTWTGRLSSSKHIVGGKDGGASGFNLQNQPKSMRGFLVSDEVLDEAAV